MFNFYNIYTYLKQIPQQVSANTINFPESPEWAISNNIGQRPMTTEGE
jgi:hypothetical protein